MDTDDIESVFDMNPIRLLRIRIRQFNDCNYGFFNKVRKLTRFGIRKMTFGRYPKKNNY